jgi:hypothetical protein
MLANRLQATASLLNCLLSVRRSSRKYTRLRSQARNPPTPSPLPGKGTTVRHEVFEAGAIFPSASVNRQVRCIALTPFVPLSRLRERGNALQGAPPCAPTPLSTLWERGWG